MRKFQLMADRTSRASGTASLTIVNDVDFSSPPADLALITRSTYGARVPKPNLDELAGCSCRQPCGQTCPCSSSYTRDGKLNTRERIVQECSAACHCDERTCPARPVQRGRQLPLTIYRIDSVLEWGLRTDVFISKDSFVEEYVGEIISVQESRLRSNHAYLFDLDIDCEYGEESAFTVDARFFGNASRFINHSCEPNLRVMAVMAECKDTRLHRIAFFASRDIAAGEQLTFDYSGLTSFSEGAPPEKRASKKRKKPSLSRKKTSFSPRASTAKDDCEASRGYEDMKCLCNAKTCRKLIIPYI